MERNIEPSFLVTFNTPAGWISGASRNEDYETNRNLVKDGAYSRMNEELQAYVKENNLQVAPWEHVYYQTFVALECSEETVKKITDCPVVLGYARNEIVQAFSAPKTPRP